MTVTLRYPGGPITPSGGWRLLRSHKPHITYRSWGDDAVFHLAGPLAAPFHDRAQPSVSVVAMKGLIPPWKPITQKGATQDGATFVTALYDPLEGEMTVEVRGKTVQDCSRIIRDWQAAWDPIKEGELSWFTPYAGRWWAPVRWNRTPVDKLRGGDSIRQTFVWSYVAYDAFWRSYDDVDQFGFVYEHDMDGFDYVTADGDPLTGWTAAYSVAGSGHVYTNGAEAVSSLSGRTAVLRRDTFLADTDNQVAEIELGTYPGWYYPQNAYVDLWVRMANTGTPGVSGLRLRISSRTMVLSEFVNTSERVIRTVRIWPPQRQEKWTLITGIDDNPTYYRILRGKAVVANIKDTGAALVGAGYRRAGFGMATGAGGVRPPGIRSWSVGDNNEVQQDGYVYRANVGDQPMFDRYTCFGPGTFSFANGPGSLEMVSFGPLLRGQIAQVRADPRKYGVLDLTSEPPTPQEQAQYKKALLDITNWATANNVTPLLKELQSPFGVTPPQGNLYRLLSGRFSDAAAIPPKPAGQPAPVYPVKVSIDGGNAESRIIVAGTPLRRWPY